MLQKDYSKPSGRSWQPGIHFWRDLNIFLILFFFCSFFAFLFLNRGAFWRDLRYALYLNSPFASADLKREEILQVANAATIDNPGAGMPIIAPGEVMILTIPKISAVAPIVIPSDNSKATVLASLEEGVGIYPGSVFPGEIGRTVLLGHSSKASWYHGDYAYIFTLLEKLDPPDEFYITAQGKKYIYQVFAHRTLPKTETDRLLEGPSIDSEVDLVTCYPVGSASKRTVIQAKLLRVDSI